MNEVKTEWGECISQACERLQRAAPAFMVFNDVRVEAAPGDTAGDLQGRWTAEMDRRRREYEASDRYKDDQAEVERRSVAAQRVRAESLAVIAASGVREKYPWTDAMGEISGFGGGYEIACRDMVYAGLAWLQAKPGADLSLTTTEDVRALEKATLAVCPDCSGMMSGAAMIVIAFIAKNGWDEFVRRMAKRAATSKEEP